MKWKCRDIRLLSPSEMTIEEQVNCISMYTRRLMKASNERYFLCAEGVCAFYPVLGQMAANVRAAGKDPFKDYGDALTHPDCTTDYPLKDVF